MPSKIDTPARRKKLAVAKAPIWSSIGDARSGLKIGYRKGRRKSTFIGKLILSGHRVEVTLGPADDQPGTGMSFAEAVAAVIAWAGRERARLEAGIDAERTRVAMVGDAVETYIKMRIARAERAGQDAKRRLTRHVLSDRKIASLPMARLTARALTEWRARLPETLSPASINRLCNDFRACLNLYVGAHWRSLPTLVAKEVMAGLKSLPGSANPRRALLSDSDVRWIVEASYEIDPDFGALVLTLAATGCRFSQAAAITCRDLQAAGASRIMVPSSMKGRGSKSQRFAAVPLGVDVIDRLKPLIAGRSGSEPLLMRTISRQADGAFAWEPIERVAWSSASQMSRPWKKALANAGIRYLEPYALRHTHIVHCLRSGLPTRLVAALHDTSSAMVEAHYSAFILDASDELARRSLMPLVSAPAALSVVS